jgi:hypothetical protein
MPAFFSQRLLHEGQNVRACSFVSFFSKLKGQSPKNKEMDFLINPRDAGHEAEKSKLIFILS